MVCRASKGTVRGPRRCARSCAPRARPACAALTLYAFSAQNWQRPLEEIATLMQLLRDYVIDERAEIMDNDIRLVAIGELDRLPAYAREPLDALVRDSAGNRGMTLCLALSYGGRESIVAAARALGESVASGEITAEEITEEKLTASLQTGGLPQLDLLVRTSGEERLSNFLLWEAAYAELYFTETYWPAFGKTELYQALESFRGRERRFGRTREQIRSAG